MNRATDYFGKFLRHGNAYPDRVMRLFDRRRGGFRGFEIHETTRVDGPVEALDADLEHFSYRNFSDQRQRMRRYATLMAEALTAPASARASPGSSSIHSGVSPAVTCCAAGFSTAGAAWSTPTSRPTTSATNTSLT